MASSTRGADGEPDTPAHDSSARLDVACLVFEADNVLFDATLWRRWLHQLLGRFGVQADFETFFARWDREYLADVYRGRREFDEAFQSFLLSSGLTPAQFDEIEAASTAKRRDLAISTRLLPGVRSALWQLHGAGYRLAVLTNDERSSTQISTQLERNGLGGLFHTVLSSFDLELTMPEPAAYAAILTTVDESADRTAFVSSCPVSLLGAIEQGMRGMSIGVRPAATVHAHFDSLADFAAWMSAAERCAATT
ncbi:MAG: HAD hydrolase-like protein [Pirellulales bacterium]|nr:HAD hydrolase-like protein [Pirellulales bacterium]